MKKSFLTVVPPGRILQTWFLIGSLLIAVFPLQAQQNIWTGAGTNSTPGNTNWSNSANWSAGALGPNHSVVFLNPGAVASVSNINNIVDANTTIFSLQYGNTSNNHTTLINPGVTLTVSNNVSTNIVFVGTATDNGVSQIVDATLTGPGGKLTVVDTNVGSAMQMQQGSSGTGSHIAILDLSGLGTFNLTAGRLLIAGSPSSAAASNYMAGALNLASTNIIQLNGTTTPQLLVGDASSNPNNLTNFLQLGQTNALYVDNLTIGRGKQIGMLRFNSSLAGNSPALYLRGNSSAQVTTLAIGDNGTQTGTSSSSTGAMDLSLGTVNAQVNTCILARGQISATSTGGAIGTLTLNAGVFSVNTLNAGVVNTNNASYNVTATVNVTGTATLVVNTVLALGTNPNTNTANANCYARGTLNVTNGAVYANSIVSPSTVGVIGTINVNNGSLTISNTAGSAASRLAALNLTGAALHLVANPNFTNIAATNVTGTATITIDSIGYAGGTVTYSLISYVGTDPIAGLTLAPLGAYTGTLVDNTAAKRIDLQITAGPITPILGSIVWGGGVNSNWDTTSLNWTNGTVTTVYADTDAVNFNDTGRSGNINLGVNVAPGSVTFSNTTLAYTLSGAGAITGAGGLTKAGTGTLTLANTNSYSGNTSLSGGTLNLSVGGALPAASAVNFTGASSATLYLQDGVQTVANLITTNNAVVASAPVITGPNGAALTVSPATLTLSPFHVTNTLNLNLSGLSSFTYSNSTGTLEARVGVVSPGGVNATGNGVQTTVTLAGGTNLITAATLNVGNNSPAGGTPIAQLNLGTNNVFNVNNLNLGSARGGDTIQFATNITGGTLTIAGAGGPGTLANMTYGGHDSFQASDSPVDLFDVTAGSLNAQFASITIGRDAPTANMNANRGVNNSSSFKMGAGTLTVSNMTLGVILSAAGDTGSYTYNLTNTSLFSINNGGTANIGNLTLANNNYAGNLSGASRLSATVLLTNGATLNASNIQEGAIAAVNQGTLNIIPQLLWGDGTLANLPGGGLTVNGVFFTLAGAATTHNLNIASGQIGQINAWIAGTGTLTDIGAGTVILEGENSFNGALVMNSTNALFLANANTYTGNTIINSGTLFITNAGAYTGSLTSPNVIVQSNAVFDVSPAAPYTFGATTNQNLAGYGSINGSLIAGSGAQIVPGSAGTAGTLTFSNDLTLTGQIIHFDLSSSPTGKNDLINVGGILTLNANATIWINMLNGTLSPGTYTLMTYSALAANGNNFVLIAPRGITLNPGANALTLDVTSVSSANLTWVGDGSANNWDVFATTNWLNAGALDYFDQLDNVTFDDTGSASPAVNLTAILAPSSITVSAAQNYTFSSSSGGQLAGTMNLIKKGTGTLSLQTSNTYSGTTTVSNGVLELDNAGAAGTGIINLAAGALDLNLGGGTLANTIVGAGTINVLTTSYQDTILGGSLSGFTGLINVPADVSDPNDTSKMDILSPAVNLSGAATINIASGGTLYAAGNGVIIAATNNVAGSGNGDNLGALHVDAGAVIAGRVNLFGNTVIGESTVGTISGIIADGGQRYGITAVGSGTNILYLLATNTYTGGTTISNGILSLGNGLVNGSLPLTSVPVTNYGILQFNVPTNVAVTPTQPILGPGGVSKLSDGSLSLAVSNGFSGGLTTGNGTGNGTSGGIIYLLNACGFGDPSISETVSVVRAEVRLAGGITVATNVYFQTSANSALTTAGSGYVAFRNLSATNIIPNPIEMVTGAGNSEFASDAGLLVFDGTIFLSTASARTAVFSGAGNGLVNGALTNATTALSVQKTGAGTWTLAGANTYAGTTTVSGGTLLVNGSITTNVVTVQSSGTLGGSGSIGGPVNLQTGGTIQGGDANGTNTLTIATLNLGTASTNLTYSRFTIARGGEVAASALNVSGTNIVQILDSSFAIGTNTLFTYGGTIGGGSGFAGLQLGALPTGVTAQLLNTGSAVQLAVTSLFTVNTNPPVLSTSVNGNTLTLSWPADHKGWQLEVQTNSLGTGLSTNWSTWPSSAAATTVAITNNPADPAMFFRLIYQ